MFTSITQNMVDGSLTKGTQNRMAAAMMWKIPYKRSAFIQRSARIPAMAGINREAIPMVEKIAPNSVPDHCLF